MVAADDEECIVEVHRVAVAPRLALRYLDHRVGALEELPIQQHQVWCSFVKEDAAMLMVPKALQLGAAFTHAVDFQCGMFAIEAHAIRRFAHSGWAVQHKKLPAIPRELQVLHQANDWLQLLERASLGLQDGLFLTNPFL